MDYNEFEKNWLRRHKGSIPQRRRVSSASTWFWIAFWVLVAGGAAIFSAAHTIPAAELTILKDVPFRADLAKSVFVIVELVIFGASAGRREIWWLKYLLWAAVLVALVGNVSSSVSAVTENGGNLLNQFGGILLSIIAPTTALAAGEVLHIQLDKLSKRRAAADEEYQVKRKELDSVINREFTKAEKVQAEQEKADRLAAEKAQAEREEADRQALTASALSVRSDADSLQTRQTGYGYSVSPDGQLKVIAYLKDNPDAAKLGSRELGRLIGVSHDTANNGRKEWQRQQQLEASMNGNGHHSGDQS